jgi:hypothetical protein
MNDSTNSQDYRCSGELMETQLPATRTWVKPTLEQLSLKRALTGNGKADDSTATGVAAS